MKKINGVKKQHGFLSVEIMIVVAILLVILVGVVARGGKLFNSTDAADEQANISTIIVNTKELKTSSGYGASGANLVPSLVNADGIPKGMTVDTGVPYNSWGGAVAVVSTGAGFTVTDNAVPKDSCIKMSTKMANMVDSTKINTSSAVVGEVTTATASAQCTSDTANIIIWTMKN